MRYECLRDLIEKGNKPNSNLEYFILRDLIHYGDHFQDDPVTIKEGTIVINVEQAKGKLGYYFIVKETGLKVETNYPWALAEYTEENYKKYEEYKEKEKIALETEKERIKFLKRIKTL